MKRGVGRTKGSNRRTSTAPAAVRVFPTKGMAKRSGTRKKEGCTSILDNGGEGKAKGLTEMQALTSATIAGLSDLVAQRLVGHGSYKYKRTAAMAAFGLLWGGPSLHYWQRFMEKMFHGKKNLSTTAQKVLVDQVTYGPINNIMMMSYIALVVDRATVQAAFARVQGNYPSVQLKGWQVWPLASLINYRFVPLKLRVLFANMVALCWSTFLILQAKQKSRKSR